MTRKAGSAGVQVETNLPQRAIAFASDSPWLQIEGHEKEWPPRATVFLKWDGNLSQSRRVARLRSNTSELLVVQEAGGLRPGDYEARARAGKRHADAASPARETFLTVKGLAVSPDGGIYFSDAERGGRVRALGKDGMVRTVAQGLPSPAGMAFHSQNLLVVHRHRIVSVAPNGDVAVVAGSEYGFRGDGGPAGDGMFGWPSGIAVDAEGNIYVCDRIE